MGSKAHCLPPSLSRLRKRRWHSSFSGSRKPSTLNSPPLLTQVPYSSPPSRTISGDSWFISTSPTDHLWGSSAHPPIFSRLGGNTGSNGIYHTCHRLHHLRSRSIHRLHWWSSRLPQPDTAQDPKTAAPVEPDVFLFWTTHRLEPSKARAELSNTSPASPASWASAASLFGTFLSIFIRHSWS